jgi:hypothetical protein
VHRAIANNAAMARAKDLMREHDTREALAEIFPGTARVLAGRLVTRMAVDAFRIEGSADTFDTVAAVAILTGRGNPLPAIN